jgi:membrane protein
MKHFLKAAWEFTAEVLAQYFKDRCMKLGAALSFYTLFSLAPLLVISIALAGVVYGREAARGEVVEQIRTIIGRDGALIVQMALKNSRDVKSGILATAVGLALLLIGATVVFAELQDSLNMIWQVKARAARGLIKGLIIDRLVSFVMVMGVGALLLFSLLLSAVLAALGNLVSSSDLPTLPWLNRINFLVSLGVLFLLFAMIFKVLPDVRITWSDVWIGALVTSVLFVLGKHLIGLYLGISTLASTYGAAGSLVALLLWIYYSAQILFLGAEFTEVYAVKFGSGIRPGDQFVRYEERSVGRGA